jgi:hypothetical protein
MPLNGVVMAKINNVIVSCIAFLFAFLGFRIIWLKIVAGHGMISTIIFSTLFFVISFGLFRKHRWALRGVAFIFLMIAIILPAGLFNPFTAGDYFAAGMEPPAISQTLIWLIPVEIFLLTVIYVIDPKNSKNYKDKMKNEGITPHSSRTPDGAA